MSSGRGFQDYLKQVGLLKEGDTHVRTFGQLDEALEWCEDRILDKELKDREATSMALDLGDVHILSALGETTLKVLRQCVVERTCLPGEKVFAAGDKGDELFLISTGTVKIQLPVGGKQVHLVTLDRGDFFGDMSFLDQRPRSADAVAAVRTKLFVISRASFDKAAEGNPRAAGLLMEGLCHALSDRLRHANTEIRALQES